jgi:hypothetical protein
VAVRKGARGRANVGMECRPFFAAVARTGYEGRMPDEEEHQPGDRAPATAHYEELNVFGTPTGAVSRFVKETGFHLHRGALRGDGYGGSAE